MLASTVAWLRCPGPKCAAPLALKAPSPSADVLQGALRCAGCGSDYPILAGVAVVVPDPGGYLLAHVKGIARFVPDGQIPAAFRREFAAARREIETGHIEDDLEAERVNALYLMTHFLTAAGDWWKPGPPLFDALIREHWDRGPFARLRALVGGGTRGPASLIELGCGVGGLLPALATRLTSYLGVDSSFASIAHARRLALRPESSRRFKVPGDLLQGGTPREVTLPPGPPIAFPADFVVGDLEHPPLQPGAWDACAALNAIDMMHEPRDLPRLQHSLLRPGGLAYQSGPYIWHESIARRFRKRLPKDRPELAESAAAVEWLYEQAGFEITRREDDIPWLFYKHRRQLEIYSVHLIEAKRRGA